MTENAPRTPTTASRLRDPITRRWLLNLVLLLLIGGLAVFAWYRPENPSEAAKPKLTSIDPESVRRVSIERSGQEPVTLERSDEGWRLLSPVKARADTMAVDSLLRLAQAPIEATVTRVDPDLARYGLHRPSVRVRFDDTEIHFGDMHPLRDQYYARVGENVYLVSSWHYGQVVANYPRYIDSRLIEPGRNIAAINLPGFSVARKDATWERRPEIAALSSDRINAFIDDWRHARALVVEKNSGKRATEQVSITFDDNSKIAIGIVSRTPQLVLLRQDENLLYQFPADTAERLLQLTAEETK